MKCYIVGGWVRDSLLSKSGYNVIPKDKDWVVVGSTPEEMIAKGFIPVGKDFPVFLHPKTKEEYALARTERKTGHGYHGFKFFTNPKITLIEDLARRDLTINAMAIDSRGNLTDPYGGEQDLRNKILRHVSPAFSEDPVRILRLARFKAQFPEFKVSRETLNLLKQMISEGETDALVPERIHAEIAKGLLTKKPSAMFEILIECGFWERAYKSYSLDQSVLRILDKASHLNYPLAMRFACLTVNMNKDKAKSFLRLIRASREEIEAASILNIILEFLASKVNTENLSNLMKQTDATRKPDRLISAFNFATEVISPSELTVSDFANLVRAWKNIDNQKILACVTDKSAIGQIIQKARENALTIQLNKFTNKHHNAS